MSPAAENPDPRFDHERFNRLCKASGKSGRDLGFLFRVTDMTVFRWRNGTSEPTSEALIRIADWSNMSAHTWMRGGQQSC